MTRPDPSHAPLIGITLDVRVEADQATSPRTYHSGTGYGEAVTAAGGVPLWLGHDLDALPRLLSLCDGFILTGGGDPDMQAFGEANHPAARVIDPRRQAFECAMLDALDTPEHAATPLLGVCLGMQLIALRAGGRLDQYMPDTMGDAAAAHARFVSHRVTLRGDAPMLSDADASCAVISSHRQRVIEPGGLAVVAVADDGTIEAVWDPARPWRLGVQWHAERSRDLDHPLGWGLIRRLVRAAARKREATPGSA